MTSLKRLVVLAIAAAGLAGCATIQPLSIEEKVWFDKATGYDIIPDSPALQYAPPAYAPANVPIGYRG